MNWKAVLADLRAYLPPERDGPGRQQRGSLRWLEEQMRSRGANPVSVRNIIYRDIGTAADRAALQGILAELARELGRPLVREEQTSLRREALPEELELLGRSKKRAYKQFLAGVRAGRAPRLIVSGRVGAGKTVLLSQLARTLTEAGVEISQVFLSGEVGARLAVREDGGRSYAALAQAQADAARELLPAHGTLLARITAELSFHGGPPRDPDGTPVSAAHWALRSLLEKAPPGVAVLLALEETRSLPPHPFEMIALQPPSSAEARTYLMARLGVTRPEADRLLRETGRHLDRLALLVSLASGGTAGAELLLDDEVQRLVAATAALHAVSLHAPEAPWSMSELELALGRALTDVPAHARALLRAAPGTPGHWLPVPALQAAWVNATLAGREAALRRLAAAEQPSQRPLKLCALALLADWAALSTHLSVHPDDARWLPPLWPTIRQEASGRPREVLARAVVTHYAGRGEYTEPRARDALFTLLESPHDEVRGWARVKLAESSLESGNMQAAQGHIVHADVTGLHGADSWTRSAQVDALLVQAALARWQGDLDAATRAASDSRVQQGGPRALLWRGLIAKDAGRWPDALRDLRAVPPSSPLLSARARYQEGDLLLRLGQPSLALLALQEAASRLQSAGAAAEELARVLARTATTLRRLGRVEEAQAALSQALDCAPLEERRHADGILRARLLSEGMPILLALGRPDDALAQGARALELLSRSGTRPAEAEYRQRRTHYRLALSYLTRGLGWPYLQPFTGPLLDHSDLRHARERLDEFLAREQGHSDREQILRFDMLLSRALAEPQPKSALEFTARALALTEHAYEEAQARAMRAEALLRAHHPDAALAEINRAHALLRRVSGTPGVTSGEVYLNAPDPGLHAQLLTLEAQATILDGVRTVQWLREALQGPLLTPFQAGVWRVTGQALERQHPQAHLIVSELHPHLHSVPLRPADALRLGELQRLNRQTDATGMVTHAPGLQPNSQKNG